MSGGPPNAYAVAQKVLAALGLEDQGVVSLQINLHAGHLPTITITKWLMDDKAEQFTKTRWKLVPEDEA